MRWRLTLVVWAAACGPTHPPESPAAATPPETASSTLATTSPNATTSPPPETAITPTASAAPPSPPTGGSVLVGDIASPKQFDPRATLDAAKPKLVDCYNQARASNAALHGKVKLRIQIGESGAVLRVDAEPGGSANDPTLIACVGDALKTMAFPKPGGTATVVAPLVFRP